MARGFDLLLLASVAHVYTTVVLIDHAQNGMGAFDRREYATQVVSSNPRYTSQWRSLPTFAGSHSRTSIAACIPMPFHKYGSNSPLAVLIADVYSCDLVRDQSIIYV